MDVSMSSILTGYFMESFNKEHKIPTVVSNIQQIKENERTLPRKIKCLKCIWEVHTGVQKPHKIRVCLRSSFMLIHEVFSSLPILSDTVEQKAAQSLLYFRMFIFVTENINSNSIFFEVGGFL